MGFSMGQTVCHTQIGQPTPETNEEVKNSNNYDENIKIKRVISSKSRKNNLKL